MPIRYNATVDGPIAVFDSGLGGLTVVRALRRALPAQDIVYFGDTARLPYGNKSAATVTRFTREICEFLLQLGPKCIIAACNTASALAVPRIGADFALPILGVVEPCAELAARSSRTGIIAVLGTRATIASGAYERAIRGRDARLRVVQQSCPLFVPLIEEGRSAVDDPIVQMIIHDYLAGVRRLRPDVVLLGCTHYPLLAPALSEYLGASVRLIDSGEAVTQTISAQLGKQGMLANSGRRGSIQCYVSDYPQQFSRLASRFLGEPVSDVVRACAETWRQSDDSAQAAVSA